MATTLSDMLLWLEELGLSVWIRESAYGFSLMVAVHILGLTLSVGILLWVDLRLLGLAMRRVPTEDVYRSLAPWFLAGFALMLTSGLSLFAAFATAAYGNFYFRLKMAVLVLAGVNALVYHFMTERRASAESSLAAARWAGGASLVCWLAVIVAGRMMSYTMF